MLPGQRDLDHLGRATRVRGGHDRRLGAHRPRASVREPVAQDEAGHEADDEEDAEDGPDREHDAAERATPARAGAGMAEGSGRAHSRSSGGIVGHRLLAPRARCRRPARRTSVAKVANEQAADDGAAERRVLLAAFAEAERHRQHADDHRQRGHEHRPEARHAGGERGVVGVELLLVALIVGEGDDQDAVAVATPTHMIAPISAGTRCWSG